MPEIKLKVLNGEGHTLCTTDAGSQAILVHTQEYAPGDRICMETSEKGLFCLIRWDDSMLPALVYVTETMVDFPIPFAEKRTGYSPKTFSGDRHLITAQVATPEEIAARRNLALNPYDRHGDNGLFPHASANIETRGESVFAARNTIDGIFANASHGEYPYQSWGINRRADAELRVDLGVPAHIDRVGLTLRADFPHDNYWVQATLRFSDDTEQVVQLEKTALPQYFTVDKTASSVTLKDMIQSDEESPFPALTQIEVWGTTT